MPPWHRGSAPTQPGAGRLRHRPWGAGRTNDRPAAPARLPLPGLCRPRSTVSACVVGRSVAAAPPARILDARCPMPDEGLRVESRPSTPPMLGGRRLCAGCRSFDRPRCFRRCASTTNAPHHRLCRRRTDRMNQSSQPVHRGPAAPLGDSTAAKGPGLPPSHLARHTAPRWAGRASLGVVPRFSYRVSMPIALCRNVPGRLRNASSPRRAPRAPCVADHA